MRSTLFRDLALLIARIGLGVVFIAHGWQKFFDDGVRATQDGFAEMGVPLPEISAVAAATIELVSGFALLVGVLTPLAGTLLFLDMLGALMLVHVSNGVFVADGGFELAVALGVGSLLVAAFGGGRVSVDGLFGRGAGWVKTPA
ncbi:DoxX family protein [Rhodococcus marinonascens]|uniref:DoxX family protein n=1 Tax=Rhodococcus marinonascens TaxID=38311 RepID=UPI000933381B|nr:DoxX family protein [Rhodococcus marinonascens]